MAIVHHIIGALRAAGLTVYDGQVTTEPPGPYLVVDTDAGLAAPHRLSITAHHAAVTVTVMAVGRTRDGARWAAAEARRVLDGQRIPAGAPPLRQLDTGPTLRDGQIPGEARYSLTLRYRTPIPTEGAIRP